MEDFRVDVISDRLVLHDKIDIAEAHGLCTHIENTHLKGICTVFFLSECCYGLIVSVRVDSTQSICGQPLTVMLPDPLALIPS